MVIAQTEVLITVAGSERGRHLLAPGEYIIGLDPACHIRVEAEHVSPRHAKLTLGPGNAFIEDLGSGDGTRINGEPITGSTLVSPTQKILVGTATVELRSMAPESSLNTVLIPASQTAGSGLPEGFLRGRKYEIGGVVARGGMGAILDATEANTGRTVAMKVMLDSNSPADRQRFLTEAKISAQLEHPCMVPVYDLSVDENGRIFYTMQFVKGITLRKVLEQLADGVEAAVKNYPLQTLLTIFQKVCDAIAFAHSRGVIHRDLKPENIMLGDYGSVLVMDWGLAKQMRSAKGGTRKEESGAVAESSALEVPGSGLDATLSGTIMGTPQYMSPEAARGEVDTLDPRSDIYSLGAILYHLLAKRPSVAGQAAMEVVSKVARGEVRRLPTTGYPDSLVAVVHKAMALDRNQRYANVADLQADIAAYQGGFATSAEHAGLGRRIFLAVMRHKVTTAAALITLLSGVGFGTKAILEGKRAERGEALAKSEARRASSEAARANRTLAELKKTAPTLLTLAETEAGFQRFDSALEKLAAALTLNPDLTAGYWRRAWSLLAQEKFAESAEAVRAAQTRDPANAARLGAILPLLEELESAPPATRWNPARSAAVLAHLNAAGASGEAVALSSRFQISAADRFKLVSSRLKAWLGTGGGSITTDGGIEVSLPQNVDTVEPLRGLPITSLALKRTRVTNLEPLRGMPLRILSLWESKVRTIVPLAGMPLEDLNLLGTSVSDLSPLEGMPLRFLNAEALPIREIAPLRGMALEVLSLTRTSVQDLSPLRGMPLRVLHLSGTKVSDLSPLRGMPLEDLNLRDCPVQDLSPLRGMPLKTLNVISNDFSPLAGMKLASLDVGSTTEAGLSTLRALSVENLRWVSKVRELKPLIGLHPKVLNITDASLLHDLGPLLECTELEELTLVNCVASIEPLRAHKTLKVIACNTPGKPEPGGKPVAQFWKEYDAQQAAGKK